MAENDEEKFIDVARHIAKTLGHNESMADDILQIISTFDSRFSREKLVEKMGSDGNSRSFAALEHTLRSLERQLSHFLATDQPIWLDSANSSAFLDSIDVLTATMRKWAPMAAADKSVNACLLRADDMMQQAMLRLEGEFGILMRGCDSFEPNGSHGNGEFDSEDDREESIITNGKDQNMIPVAQPVTDYDIVIEALPSGIINDLQEIAKRMVAAGFGKLCYHVYSSCRGEFLEESMSRLGLRKLSNDEVQRMALQDLEGEIDKWIKAANVALRILFPSERHLCDRVFFGFSSGADLSFMEVCHGSTIQLLNFANAVAIGSRTPECLFMVLDLFEALRDLMPEFESNFSDQYCVVIRNEAVTIWKKLAEAIIGIFMELENLISRDPANPRVPHGGLHPITRYVMNYLRAACRARETLEQVFEKKANLVPSKDPLSSSLSVQIAWIMELLESNLEMKSKIYGDPALSSVFMMNNGRYIVQKVKDTELGSLLGDDWVRKHTAKIKQFLSNYQRSSWNKLLGILEVDKSTMASNVVGKPISLKDRIQLFTKQFEEMCEIQSQWIILDERLREDLRTSLINLVLPTYANFIGRLQNGAEVGKHAKYIKYSVDDIEVKIKEMFQGNSGSSGSRK